MARYVLNQTYGDLRDAYQLAARLDCLEFCCSGQSRSVFYCTLFTEAGVKVNYE